MSLRYIAASLGLSVTTVSRALAGYSDVAEETRRRVKAEAERIGYVPSAIGRRLQKGRTDAIGLVAPSDVDALTDGYLLEAFSGVWTRLSELDRDLVVLPSATGARTDGGEHRMFRRAVEERRVDGLLLLRTLRSDWRIAYLESARIPFVVFGAVHLDRPDVAAVGIDDHDAADKVLRRLVNFGHDRIALVVPEDEYDFVAARSIAFDAKAHGYGVTLRVEADRFSEAGGRSATERLIGGADHPTAIVYFSNRMALGGLAAFAQSRLIPGRHVSLISFADTGSLDFSNPALTAVRAPIAEMVRHAIDLLIARCDGLPATAIRQWPVTLVERQSDGPLGPWAGGWARQGDLG